MTTYGIKPHCYFNNNKNYVGLKFSLLLNEIFFDSIWTGLFGQLIYGFFHVSELIFLVFLQLSDQQLDWDDSELTITINPMQQESLSDDSSDSENSDSDDDEGK